jgi:hypothetical protein
MNNNYISTRFEMQRSKDDMSGVSIESTIILVYSLGVLAQSIENWYIH